MYTVKFINTFKNKFESIGMRQTEIRYFLLPVQCDALHYFNSVCFQFLLIVFCIVIKYRPTFIFTFPLCICCILYVYNYVFLFQVR